VREEEEGAMLLCARKRRSPRARERRDSSALREEEKVVMREPPCARKRSVKKRTQLCVSKEEEGPSESGCAIARERRQWTVASSRGRRVGDGFARVDTGKPFPTL
jgi:hypothetical protein